MRRPSSTDNSLNRREILQGLSAGCLAAGVPATSASAQEKYPGRPVDFIAPSGPGSGVDQLARFFSPLLEQEMKTPFPVLNVTGAVGAVAMAKLLAGRNDGYTIGLYVSSMNALVSSGRASWKLADLAPIVRLEKIPSFLFVKMDSPYKTFDELSAAVKAKPDQLKTAILGKGSLDDVTLTYMATKGFKTTIVPFAQPGERYSSILGDHADILYEQAGDVHQFLDSRRSGRFWRSTKRVWWNFRTSRARAKKATKSSCPSFAASSPRPARRSRSSRSCPTPSATSTRRRRSSNLPSNSCSPATAISRPRTSSNSLSAKPKILPSCSKNTTSTEQSERLTDAPARLAHDACRI